MKRDWFDPETSFFDLKIVQCTFVVIIVLVFAVTFSIYYFGNYELDGSADGFNLFIKDFAFPIGLLSLLIAIIALFAAQHRSKLTIRQIEESKRSNNFSIYVKHYELFRDYIEEQEHKVNIEHIKTFHLQLFINIKKGSDRIEEETQNNLYNIINPIYLHLINLQSHKCYSVDSNSIKSEKVSLSIREINKYLEILFRQLTINPTKFDLYNCVSLTTITVEHFLIVRWCRNIQKIIQLLNYAVKFSGENHKLYYLFRDLENIKYGYDIEKKSITFSLKKVNIKNANSQNFSNTDIPVLNVKYELEQGQFTFPNSNSNTTPHDCWGD
ncbi:hypothetical protein [uncultured Psychrosphaera sp.]|uniref:hypothetical protein n=1 Tax=uncultured Psychrosphaera sp. TaxID=1403522 RepID=UPI0030F6173C